jgi:hypothetical protein
MIPEPIETRTALLSLLENNIVLLEEKPDAQIEIEDAKNTVNVIGKIHASGNWAVLVDIRKMKSLTKEARDYYGNNSIMRESSGCALLTESFFSKMLGNFFIGFSKPEFPARIFNSREEAILWLKERIG